MPDCAVEITGEHGNDPRSYRVDFSKISTHLPRFQAVWSARKGAEEVLAAYLANDLTEETFSRRFKRLPWLSGLRERGAIGADLRPVDLGA